MRRNLAIGHPSEVNEHDRLPVLVRQSRQGLPHETLLVDRDALVSGALRKQWTLCPIAEPLARRKLHRNRGS